MVVEQVNPPLAHVNRYIAAGNRQRRPAAAAAKNARTSQSACTSAIEVPPMAGAS
jgi:hypothetical protein